MASASMMGSAGISMVAKLAIILTMTLIGGLIFENVITPILAATPTGGIVDPSILTFAPGLFYAFMLFLAIAVVWRTYQKVVAVVDYGQNY